MSKFKYDKIDFFSISKKWSFLDIFGKILRIAQVMFQFAVGISDR